MKCCRLFIFFFIYQAFRSVLHEVIFDEISQGASPPFGSALPPPSTSNKIFDEKLSTFYM